MSLTRAQLQVRLDAYLAAEVKILAGQEYQIGDGVTTAGAGVTPGWVLVKAVG